ncbi:classical arabinogalactan protein 26-like [Tripterygium wilfordii]|uniref:classical arabinogalactan protein 26-like n=1 Tax=Tripterygium wilfordii TaxID=458696 RepID=UPI0018F7FF1E|nr:classical arabinogalactan protein 26-like [Tripterygium wilfordii]
MASSSSQSHTHSPHNISRSLSVLRGHIHWRIDLHNHLMAAPFGSMLMFFFMVYFTSLALASPAVVNAQFSTISAAPAFLPGAPMASPPGLSPDIEPLFPTNLSPSPTESSPPIISSNPSPPNPDNILAPGHGLGAFPPSEALPTSSSVSSGPVNLVFFVGFLCFCLIQLSGM